MRGVRRAAALRGGRIRCVVCEAPGRCGTAAARPSAFGAGAGARRGVGRRRGDRGRDTARPRRRPRLPADGEVLVGGLDDMRDVGPGGLDLVAILDVDLADRRPGLAARERAVTTWMEAIAWARPGGRAIVQTSRAERPRGPGARAGEPRRFHGDEAPRRAEAGFPVGSPVFRVAGTPGFEASWTGSSPRPCSSRRSGIRRYAWSRSILGASRSSAVRSVSSPCGAS